MTDHTELKRLLSAQVSLHQVARKTETVEDEDAYLAADDALNDYLTEQDLFIEEAALAVLTENTRLESEAVYAAAEFDAAREEIARLKAEQEALSKDAERYQWLRDSSESVHQFYLSTPIWFTGVKFSKENVDSTIDAAMREEPQP